MGFCDGMGEASHQIRSIVYCNSSYEKAYELTKDMLNRYPQIDLLVATNEYGAIGAARAVRKSSRACGKSQDGRI